MSSSTTPSSSSVRTSLSNSSSARATATRRTSTNPSFPLTILSVLASPRSTAFPLFKSYHGKVPTESPPFPFEMCPHQLILFMRRWCRPANTLRPKTELVLGAWGAGGSKLHISGQCDTSFKITLQLNAKLIVKRKYQGFVRPMWSLVRLHIFVSQQELPATGNGSPMCVT